MKAIVGVLALVLGLGLPSDLVAQEARLVKLPELRNLIEGKGEDIRVVNFWATWCGPCVKEMPLFEKLNGAIPGVSVYLVSMDMDLDPNPGKVNKFVARKKLQSKVLILDEVNPNDWIEKIEKGWSGAIPATIVYNSKTGKRVFVEHELHDGDLEKMIAEVQQ